MNYKKPITWKLILFEVRNIIGSPFIHIFGIGFPIFMVVIICKAIAAEMPSGDMLRSAQTQVILGIGTIIPLATILMGYACQYSQELEKEIPLRMLLFGFREKHTMINRIIAECIFMSVAFIIYFTVVIAIFDIVTPTWGGVVAYFLLLYLISGILFLLSHSIASIIKKFGATYVVVMALYFGIMILSGMMGIKIEALPGFLQNIAKLIPFYYYNQQEFLSLWTGESYNFIPMLQSLIFLGAISGIILFISLRKSSRSIR